MFESEKLAEHEQPYPSQDRNRAVPAPPRTYLPSQAPRAQAPRSPEPTGHAKFHDPSQNDPEFSDVQSPRARLNPNSVGGERIESSANTPRAALAGPGMFGGTDSQTGQQLNTKSNPKAKRRPIKEILLGFISGGFSGYATAPPEEESEMPHAYNRAPTSEEGFDLRKFLPGGSREPYHIALMRSDQRGIHPSSVDIFDRITQRLTEKCLLGTLIACEIEP